MAEIPAAAPQLFFDLSDRSKFRVRGDDRSRFLNGQITNDLRKATETEAIEACVLNAKGRIDAHVFITSEPDAYLLDTDGDLRESLPARLDRYIIADDVQLEDVTEELSLFHLLASEINDLPNEYKVVRARRFLNAGWDVWTKKSEEAEARGEIYIAETTHFPLAKHRAANYFVFVRQVVYFTGKKVKEQQLPLPVTSSSRTSSAIM